MEPWHQRPRFGSGNGVCVPPGNGGDQFRCDNSFGFVGSLMSWKRGNLKGALRKLRREAEQRPLLLLAVAVGVGALALGFLSRR